MCYTGPDAERNQHCRNQKHAQGGRRRFPRLDHRRLRLLRPGLLRLRHREGFRPFGARRRAHHHRQPDDPPDRRIRLRPARRPLRTPPHFDRQHRVLHADGDSVRPGPQLHGVLPAPFALRRRHGRQLGRGSFARAGIGVRQMAGHRFRDPAGRLRCRQRPGRDRVLHSLSPIRLARDVLRRRDPGTDHHRAVFARRGIPRMEGIENGRGQLPRDSVLELEALPIPLPDHVRHEFHLARHPGHVSDVPAKPARLQRAGHVDRNLRRRAGRDHRRGHAGALLERMGPAAHDRERDLNWAAGNPAVDPGAHEAAADAGGVPHAGSGARSVGSNPSAYQRTVAARGARLLSRLRLPDRRAGGFGVGVYRSSLRCGVQLFDGDGGDGGAGAATCGGYSRAGARRSADGNSSEANSTPCFDQPRRSRRGIAISPMPSAPTTPVASYTPSGAIPARSAAATRTRRPTRPAVSA